MSWFYRRPATATATVALVVTAVLAVLLWWAFGFKLTLAPALVSWLVAVNVTAFATYGIDKRQAGANGRRVPEATLWMLAALGGSPGAFAAMWLFRHKTVKGSFRIVFWLIVAVQAALLIWVAKVQLTE
jgi:uncharacterized membrane protein YsdA (DUF1294 family)